jgi:hypothetical protein
MLIRQKAREVSGFWVKKRPDLLGLSLDELKELLGEESTLLKSIVHSGATLTGTVPIGGKRRTLSKQQPLLRSYSILNCRQYSRRVSVFAIR